LKLTTTETQVKHRAHERVEVLHIVTNAIYRIRSLNIPAKAHELKRKIMSCDKIRGRNRFTMPGMYFVTLAEWREHRVINFRRIFCHQD
jgi:hypothetical protein